MKFLSIIVCGLAGLGMNQSFALEQKKMLTIEDFRNEARQSKSLEDFLSKVPRDYMEEWTVMRDSASSQAGTEAEPRAIVFGNKGKVVFTFNGSSEQKGGDLIELMYLDKNNEYKFQFFHPKSP